MTIGQLALTRSRIKRALKHRSRQASALIRRRVRAWWEVRVVRRLALRALVGRTGNFSDVHWLGRPVIQNITDIWALQEVIVDRDVDLVLECGTNRGGLAHFFATLFDLRGKGHVITVDVRDLVDFTHPRIEFLHGSSTDTTLVTRVRQRIAELAPEHVLVVLDSDHSEHHVLQEIRSYADLVGVGDYVVVQDGVIDELRIFSDSRPGPLGAIRRFLSENDRFEIDKERSTRFLFNHSPSGWLRRVR
jgi:cephalosporin hydroxylase